MSANERRAEIMRILLGRRRDTIPQLAAELQVSRSTVNRDILALTEEYPLETFQGNGGGVGLPEWYRPHKNLLSNRHRSQRWPPGKAAYRNPGILWATKNPQRNSR